MSNIRWLGKAKDVTQINTITTNNTFAQGDTVTITVDGVDLVITVGTLVTISEVATTIKEAFNGESLTDTDASCSPSIAEGGGQAIPQLTEMVATASGAVVTLTGTTAGKPFTITVTENTAGSGTATGATATAATGKHFWSNADNWEGGNVPVNNDTPVFDQGNVDLKYDLTTGIQPASFIHTKGYTGRIGLPNINTDSPSRPYPEYRGKYLAFTNNSVTCTYTLFDGAGAGSPLVRIDAGAGQSIFNVMGTGPSASTSQPVLLLKGTHTSNVLDMSKGGNVGVAFFTGETAALASVRVGPGAVLVCGTGVTFNSVNMDISGGTVTINTATASGDIDISNRGTLYTLGTGAHASIDVQSGILYDGTSGTITTLALGEAGIYDRTNDLRPKTITNLVECFASSIIRDPHKTLTLSNGFRVNGKALCQNFDFGTGRTYTVA